MELLSRALFFFLLLSMGSSNLRVWFLAETCFRPRKATCPVNFEFMNYTIITSKCKGPKYPPKECCGAFKDFACPYTDQLNDLSSDCATTMFSYINLYGKYPPGLFANQCKEGKEGLECPAGSQLPPETSAEVNAATTSSSRLWLTVSAALLVFVKLF
ncbi:unnamed protein product [Arabidopsis thaliana]|uniref:GPI-anchored protein LLG1-like domain-containing protein n=1 Tax=Arabidopsis thaliana TaxID=3702 RepID=A0A654GCH9_ARATH|nr:unnamed protein product [Arabidopsis thaliana]